MRSSHLAVGAIVAGAGLLGWSIGGVSHVDSDLRTKTSQPVAPVVDTWHTVDVDVRDPGPWRVHTRHGRDRREDGV